MYVSVHDDLSDLGTNPHELLRSMSWEMKGGVFRAAADGIRHNLALVILGTLQDPIWKS